MRKSRKSKLRKDGDFIPPDGGWGWMIVFAAGFSNLSMLPMLQQFGLLFRDRFSQLHISSSETTTIINMHSALMACVGLANGPVFRTFSYRQVSLTGSIIVFIALLCTTFSYNFATYLISFSLLYGAGYGMCSSANALALNTYWKNRRRLATGLSWTTTGLGPIIWPQIITGLFLLYGEIGATLILSGFALHAVACSLLLHPVEWHSKAPRDTQQTAENTKHGQHVNENVHVPKIKNIGVFSSQYIYNEDNPITTGYEIIDPVPMMIKANDGYFSKKNSTNRSNSKEGSSINSCLNFKKPSMVNLSGNQSRKSTLYSSEPEKDSSTKLGAPSQESHKSKRKTSIVEIQMSESEIEDCPTLKIPQNMNAEEKLAVENIDPDHTKNILDKAEKHFAGSKSLKSFCLDNQYGEKYNKDNHSNIPNKLYDKCDARQSLNDNHSTQSDHGKEMRRKKTNNFNYERKVLKKASLQLELYLKKNEDTEQKLKLLINVHNLHDDDKVSENVNKDKNQDITKDEEEERPLTFCQKVAVFFDLDLLKDYTFVNLMLGMTLASFNEMNFSILTPFILGDYGLSKHQVALFMSLLAGVDICVRFCIPFVAGKIGWDNNSFFLFGVLSMAMGRVVLAYCQRFAVVLVVAIIIGFGKGLRTVFVALVIPTHVPLHKLPGATGLQLLTAGIVYFSLGPVVGWIKDNATTAVTLHCLNIFTWLTALSWGLEKYFTARHQRKSVEVIVQA